MAPKSKRRRTAGEKSASAAYKASIEWEALHPTKKSKKSRQYAEKSLLGEVRRAKGSATKKWKKAPSKTKRK